MAPVHSYDIEEGWVDIFLPVLPKSLQVIDKDKPVVVEEVSDPSLGFEEEVKRLTGPVVIETLTVP
jgi:hypothetical protein